MSFISSFEIIKVIVPEQCIFFWISVSIAEAAAVIPNRTKILELLKTNVPGFGSLIIRHCLMKFLKKS